MNTVQGERWHNWSGSVQGNPREVIMPGSVNELAQCIARYARDDRHVRVIGTGHSFVPLVHTVDVLISLDTMQGIEAVDTEHGSSTVLCGTKLKRLASESLAGG